MPPLDFLKGLKAPAPTKAPSPPAETGHYFVGWDTPSSASFADNKTSDNPMTWAYWHVLANFEEIIGTSIEMHYDHEACGIAVKEGLRRAWIKAVQTGEPVVATEYRPEQDWTTYVYVSGGPVKVEPDGGILVSKAMPKATAAPAATSTPMELLSTVLNGGEIPGFEHQLYLPEPTGNPPPIGKAITDAIEILKATGAKVTVETAKNIVKEVYTTSLMVDVPYAHAWQLQGIPDAVHHDPLTPTPSCTIQGAPLSDATIPQLLAMLHNKGVKLNSVTMHPGQFPMAVMSVIATSAEAAAGVEAYAHAMPYPFSIIHKVT